MWIEATLPHRPERNECERDFDVSKPARLSAQDFTGRTVESMPRWLRGEIPMKVALVRDMRPFRVGMQRTSA